MAFTLTNRGLYALLNGAISSSTDIRQIAFTGTVPSTATIRAMNTVQDAIDSSLNEAAASGYSRPDLASVTLTEVDGSNKVTLTAAAPVLTSVAAGETWTAVGYFIHNAGADSTKDLLGIDVPTPSTLVTNGQNVTMPALSVDVTGS